jgi:Uma2 family endonuclease
VQAFNGRRLKLYRQADFVVINVYEFCNYLERYAAHFCEWVEGIVIQMSPVAPRYDRLSSYLHYLLETFFSFQPIGTVIGAPFVMRMGKTVREPDLQVILKTNSGTLTATAMNGPGDICIEVISEESVRRDYGDKFAEYEANGVNEYWLIDPIRKTAYFHRLNAQKVYEHHLAGADGYYITPLLPGLVLHVPTLWQETLPDIVAVVQSVQRMLNTSPDMPAS